MFIFAESSYFNCKTTLDCSTLNDGLTTRNISFLNPVLNFFLASQEDLICPRTLLQNVIWTSLYRCVEPVLSSWPINKLRERALGNIMEHIHYEDENTQYLCICPVNKVNISKSLMSCYWNFNCPCFCSVVVVLLLILLLHDLVFNVSC